MCIGASTAIAIAAAAAKQLQIYASIIFDEFI
jgi:hypothetical protein